MRSLLSPLSGLASPFGASVSAGGGGVSLGILAVDNGGTSSADPTRYIHTISAAAVAGDIIVFWATSRINTDTHSISGGTGTAATIGKVNSTVGSNYSMSLHTYIIGAGDTPGTTQITIASTQTFINFSVAAITVQGTSGIDVTGAPAQIGGFNANPTAPAVMTTVDDALVVFGVGQPTNAIYSSGTYTEQVEATIGTAGLAVYSLVKATAGSTGALQVSALQPAPPNNPSSNYNYGSTIAFKP